MAKGTGRTKRESLLDALAESDPELHAELLELRRYNPQAFRKALAERLPPKERGRQVQLARRKERLAAIEVDAEGHNELTRRAIEGARRDREELEAGVARDVNIRVKQIK